ncbi:MAG: AAA family ATPase [Candidatus Omnitrophota bacterium]
MCNFRSLKKCSITLEPVTLLIGTNDSGKTSFLRALNLVLEINR